MPTPANAAPKGETFTTVAAREVREAKVTRIAVVFTHGQGEQTPMTDVAELARALWTTAPETDQPGFDRNVWSVPVFDSDLSEQRRLVTGELTMQDGQGLQVDFYQFYWADLMGGNRFKHLWVWFLGLMRRKYRIEASDLLVARGEAGLQPPLKAGDLVDETPPRLAPIRKVAMGTALALAVFATVFGVSTALLLFTPAMHCGVVSPFEQVFTWSGFWGLIVGVGTVYVAANLALRPRREQALSASLALIPACLALGSFARTLKGAAAAALPTSLTAVWSVLAVVAVLGLLVFWFCLRRLNESFLTPVMADSARLLSAVPENIPNRDRIRKRGMELFDALHNSERRYDRIIVLAHSLGTVVSYNVLSQYWGNVYRLFNRDATNQAYAELVRQGEALATAEAALQGPPRLAALQAFRQRVRDYYAVLTSYAARLPRGDVEWRTAQFNSPGGAIRAVLDEVEKAPEPTAQGYRAPWRISDFITIGSPLTYASLLLADRDAELKAWVEARRFPLCPPQKGDAVEPHHASLFGATVWTNLHFQTKGLVQGDMIGGPIAGAPPRGLGLGIMDVTTPPSLHMPKFAHSEYWRWSGDVTPGAPGGEAALHIQALRAAFNLFGKPPHATEAVLVAVDAASDAPTVSRVAG